MITSLMFTCVSVLCRGTHICNGPFTILSS
uniref:Uncharacterized protein n=1 Tax=Arundo donax TaxID=35708 RepID=A0A0A9BMT7_ARUDO